MEKIFIIEDGGLFEGTLAQFEDNFFSNADEDSIRDWCETQGYSLKIVERELQK